MADLSASAVVPVAEAATSSDKDRLIGTGNDEGGRLALAAGKVRLSDLLGRRPVSGEPPQLMATVGVTRASKRQEYSVPMEDAQ